MPPESEMFEKFEKAKLPAASHEVQLIPPSDASALDTSKRVAKNARRKAARVAKGIARHTCETEWAAQVATTTFREDAAELLFQELRGDSGFKGVVELCSEVSFVHCNSGSLVDAATFACQALEDESKPALTQLCKEAGLVFRRNASVDELADIIALAAAEGGAGCDT